MGAGFGCGPEDEIRETERLASMQDEQDRLDGRDDDFGTPDTFDALSSAQEDFRAEAGTEPDGYFAEERDWRISFGHYSEADARSAGLPTIPANLIGFVVAAGSLPESRKSMHSNAIKEDLYYFPQRGDALEVITVPVNTFGDKAREQDVTVGFKITICADRCVTSSPECGALIFFASTESQVQMLHDLAWAMSSVPGRKMEDAKGIIDCLRSAATLMGIKTHELMPAFPLNTDSSYARDH